jgi:hypothetical protein
MGKRRSSVTVEDVYFLALHEPYRAREHPTPINTTIVHALTLLNPAVPQPDGGRMYRCLTEFPVRTPGCVVPLSTLTFELAGGRLWSQVGDWERVVKTIVHLSRERQCDAMPLGLPQTASMLLANGPTSSLTVYRPDGNRSIMGWRDRQRHIDELAGHVRDFVAGGPFWPGEKLVQPPRRPAKMPYQPYDSDGPYKMR